MGCSATDDDEIALYLRLNIILTNTASLMKIYVIIINVMQEISNIVIKILFWLDWPIFIKLKDGIVTLINARSVNGISLKII